MVTNQLEQNGKLQHVQPLALALALALALPLPLPLPPTLTSNPSPSPTPSSNPTPNLHHLDDARPGLLQLLLAQLIRRRVVEGARKVAARLG